jgi:NTP pyrophosphatase (non-canonical NTP hydrolase)
MDIGEGMDTKLKDNKLTSIFALTDLVRQENDRQLKKWGVQEHTPYKWLAIIAEEEGELAKAVLEYETRIHRNGTGRSEIVNEAIQVATLALKIAEMYGY